MVFSLHVRLNNFIQKVIIIHGMNKNRDKRKRGPAQAVSGKNAAAERKVRGEEVFIADRAGA